VGARERISLALALAARARSRHASDTFAMMKKFVRDCEVDERCAYSLGAGSEDARIDANRWANGIVFGNERRSSPIAEVGELHAHTVALRERTYLRHAGQRRRR
jgi:hypothetical protein